MLSGILDLLGFDFMRHALLAAFLCSAASGIIGSLVILNRLSYMAGAIAHAAYGGIGLAFFFSLPLLPSALGFSLAASLLMARFALRGELFSLNPDQDAAIGMLWAAGMAFGVILIECSPGYAGDILGFLFGSILAVPLSSLWIMAGLDLLLLLILLNFYQALLALSLDPEFAAARGVPVRACFYLLIGMIALAVVMLLQVVGLVLVIAMLSIPPYMARRYARTLAGMMLLSSCLCFAFCLAGLALAWFLDLSSGALIIAVAVTACGLQAVLKHG